MIAIIDYDAGNLKSVEKALVSLGEDCIVTRDAETILGADKVILPGVGAFGDAMEKLHRFGLVEVIRKVAAAGTPFLGICLGLQLLFRSSDESPGVEGIGLLDGELYPFRPRKATRFLIWDGIPLRSKRAPDCSGASRISHMYILFIPIISRRTIRRMWRLPRIILCRFMPLWSTEMYLRVSFIRKRAVTWDCRS